MNPPDIRPAPRGAHPTVAPAGAERERATSTEAAAERKPSAPPGWDPFEVWRTRVRDARRDVASRPAA